MAATPGYQVPPNTARRGWFGRNWKWVVPFIMLLGAAIGAAIVIAPNWKLKNSEPFQLAIKELRKHPKVIEAVGEPANVPGLLHMPAGTMTEEGGRGEAGFTFAWVGPKGMAEVATQARKVTGQWGLTRLVVQVKGGPTLNLTQDILSQGEVDTPTFDPNAGAKAPDSETKPKAGDMKVEIPNLPPPPQ